MFNQEPTGVFEKDVWIINGLQWVILYHFFIMTKGLRHTYTSTRKSRTLR